MDVRREGTRKRRLIRVLVITATLLVVAGILGWKVSQLKAAAPSVEKATVWPGDVKRGDMRVEVHGTGTLVPENILWIQAEFDAQVKTIRSQSGDDVKPDTILLVLSNPQMEADASDCEWQAKQAEADLASLASKLRSDTVAQESAIAAAQGDLKQAELDSNKQQALLAEKLVPKYDAQLSAAKLDQAATKLRIEQEKLDALQKSTEAQIGAQKVLIGKLHATGELKKQQVDSLTIRAGIAGKMQEMTLQLGQRVKAGDVLAKIAQPSKLMARLQLAETDAKDIALGQKAQIDTRNGIVPAHVVRIDASIVNGTRTVDCHPDAPLPAGAVPDLSVDGTIEIQNLTNVMYVVRPASAQPNSSASIFRMDGDGKGAERTSVRFGHASPGEIEILDGLKVGDRVILSDMSSQDQYARIRLN
jgi:HlyD family secretion protein